MVPTPNRSKTSGHRVARAVLVRALMKRSLFASLGLTLLAPLVACTESADECLPGDIDCADASGGKADGWDQTNDPRYFAMSLEYRLAKLPAKGALTKPTWKARY